MHSGRTVVADTLKKIIKRYSENENLSDVHIQAGRCLAVRVNGRLSKPQEILIADGAVSAFAEECLSAERMQRWQRDKSVDASLRIGSQTYRAHFYFADGRAAVALRQFRRRAPSLDDLAMPAAVAESLNGKGLILVTGPTGAGKSTSLAAMLSRIIARFPAHVLTIEDPIEYRFDAGGCALLSQREIGADAVSFESALRAALREDPDFILLGEIRDSAVAGLTLTAAETGHLVLSTMHASHCAHALSRFISMFPAEQHEQVRMRLADCVRLLINQRLFLRRDQSGRVAAYELLILSNAARHLIRDNQLFQLPGLIETARREGMISMREAVAQLRRRRLIASSGFADDWIG